MVDHVAQHGPNVVVGGRVEDLLAAPFAAQDPRRAQQPQVMAGEPTRNFFTKTPLGSKMVTRWLWELPKYWILIPLLKGLGKAQD